MARAARARLLAGVLLVLAGAAPASFVLAHFGGEMASGESDRILVSVVLLCALTLVPLFAGWLRRRRRPPQRRGRH
jgi:hypothetical protein